MTHLFSIIERFYLPTRMFLEVGSRDGNDAVRFSKAYPEAIVNIIEPVPSLSAAIAKEHGFNVDTVALSDTDGETDMLDFSANEGPAARGQNSLREKVKPNEANTATKIKVRTVTGETYLREHGLAYVDVMKIDVEGCGYEVLKGFGDSLRKVNCLQVEAELTEIWKGEKLFSDVARLLLDRGFELRHFIEFNFPTIQCDSIWTRKD